MLQSAYETGIYIYNAAANMIVADGTSGSEASIEACWVRLPNDNILTVNTASENSEHYVPSLNAWYADGNIPVPVFSSDTELGAALVLPNGKVFQIGGTTNTAIYTPGSSLTSAGTWVAGPTTVFGTNQVGANDAPAAMMVNGNILMALGPIADYVGPTTFYEYNYISNTITQISSPNGTDGNAPYTENMLDLPDGTVLLFDGGGTGLFVYKPDGTPLAAGKPSISSITQNADGSYHLTGIGLNGISGGAAYGDDQQMDSNYPLVRMTNSATGNVYYARTYNWSSTTIQNPNPVTAEFSVPANLPAGTYSLVVTVNGNPSAPTTFTYGSSAALTAPTNFTATAQTNQVLLNWSAAAGATGYNVGRSTTSGAETTIATTAGTNYTDTTAVGGTTYYYVVSATNLTGGSPNSLEVSITPLVAVPGTPTGLTATATNGQVSLRWARAAGAASYNVKRSTTSGSDYTIISPTGAVTGTNYTDATVVNSTTCYYVISATNSAGESTNSTQASATPEAPPAAPAGVTATAGTNQVSLNWIASSGANSYNVKRSATSGSGYATISASGMVTGTNYTDTTAIGGTTNYYVVSAVSAVYGEGANSTQVSATPTASATPAGLAACEPFHYATGGLANSTATTGIGFTGNWTCGAAGTIVAGLNYTGLPTTNNALQSSSSRQSESLANLISSGTNWISFLFQSGTANSGANANGVFFPNGDGTCLWFGFGLNPNSNTQGYLGLGSMATAGTSALGATNLVDSYLGTYGTTYLVVLEIIYNSSGASTNISCWINPTVASSAPGTAATMTNTTFNAGTISGIGLNVQGAGSITVDEIRVGSTYGDVVGYVAPPSAPNAPTGVAATAGNAQVVVSWNSVPGATSYNVLQGTNSGVYTVTNTTTLTSLTSTGLVNGTTYYFVVQAAGTGGVSTNSTQVSATVVGGTGQNSATMSVTSSNVTVTYFGIPGSEYVAERTTNLAPGIGIGWVVISTNTAPTNGMFQVIDLYPDLGGTQPQAAFYRLLPQ